MPVQNKPVLPKSPADAPPTYSSLTVEMLEKYIDDIFFDRRKPSKDRVYLGRFKIDKVEHNDRTEQTTQDNEHRDTPKSEDKL